MFMQYYYDIEYSNISDEDKEIFRNFLKLLDELDEGKIISISTEELRQVFKITDFNPSLQIEIWCNLPDDVVNNAENSDIFEDVLEKKFGEYLHGIDKKALVELLNECRSFNRCNG